MRTKHGSHHTTLQAIRTDSLAIRRPQAQIVHRRRLPLDDRLRHPVGGRTRHTSRRRHSHRERGRRLRPTPVHPQSNTTRWPKLASSAYDERLQLIEGEIVLMASAGNRHIAATILLTQEFAVSGRLNGLASVSVQNPVDLTERSDPEPDFQLLKPREDGYAPATPRTVDVLLAVEVSDSTLNYDVDVKIPMYAAAGIPELWIMNLREDCHRIPLQPVPRRLPSDPSLPIGRGDRAFGVPRRRNRSIAANPRARLARALAIQP